VANRESLWTLHNLAKEYGTRPSEILHIGDEWAAYQLDVMTLTTGREIEAALANGQRIEQVLGTGSQRSLDERVRAGEFRSPRDMLKRQRR